MESTGYSVKHAATCIPLEPHIICKLCPQFQHLGTDWHDRAYEVDDHWDGKEVVGKVRLTSNTVGTIRASKFAGCIVYAGPSVQLQIGKHKAITMYSTSEHFAFLKKLRKTTIFDN